MTPTDRLMQALLTEAIATAAILDPADTFVGLYISGPEPNPPLTVASFVLPDATDVPAKAATAWTAPFKLNDGRWAIQANMLTWRLPDSDNAFTANGLYLADAITAGNILAWEAIAGGINFPDALHELSLVVRLTIDPLGRWGANVLING
jgi:hypothetical protein